ncbi:MAG: pilin [Patescibacteria group bacterium]|nr:pilin [Patescibacteria group bacterium]
MNNLLAASTPIGTIGQVGQGNFGPLGDLGKLTNPGSVAERISFLLSNILAFLTVLGGIWFMIQFLVGAFKWITSGGDKNNVEAAKEHLTHAVISLAILVSAYIIVGLVGAIFGLDILNPQKILPGLVP